jgi:hypothetical protein
MHLDDTPIGRVLSRREALALFGTTAGAAVLAGWRLRWPWFATAQAASCVVHAEQPDAAKGQRTVRNAGDGIFRRGGAELLLAPTRDGAGGWASSFDIALDLRGGTTTTTLAAATEFRPSPV